GVIAWVGEGDAPADLAAGATVVDGRGCVALPGLVNTHHHLYQALTRARAQGKNLFGWLTELYPVWAALDTEWVRAAAAVGLAEESADLARLEGVRLHTHIAETVDEEDFYRERFEMRPVDLLDGMGFLGSDVWLAHCVHLSDHDVERLAATGTGVAHCPTSNLRLASGIARARDLLAAGAPVGLGVDGSASNDGGDLLAEA